MSILNNKDDQLNEMIFLHIISKFINNQLDNYLSKDDMKTLFLNKYYKKLYDIKCYKINVIENEIDPILQSLFHMVREFEKKYESELKVNLKSVTNDFNSKEVITSYEDIILTLFDEKVNTGRIIAMFAFLNATLIYLCEIKHTPIIEDIIDVTVKIFETHLNKWIIENHGWNLIVEMSNKSKKLSDIDLEWCASFKLKKAVTEIGILAALELAKSFFQ